MLLGGSSVGLQKQQSHASTFIYLTIVVNQTPRVAQHNFFLDQTGYTSSISIAGQHDERRKKRETPRREELTASYIIIR